MVSYDTSTAAGQYFATHQDAGDAWAQLQAVLDTYGLGTLSNFVQNGIIQGWDAQQAVQHMRETPEYQVRFKAIVERQKAGLPAISEADVVSTERQYAAIMQSRGLPSGFYDQPEDFTDFLIKDISPTEMQARVDKGIVAMQMAPPETKAYLQSNYGLTDGELAAYFLDPDKTEALLMKTVTSAQIGGSAARTGFGTLGRSEAEGLTDLGVTEQQAQQGFTDLAKQRELMTSLPGEADNNISQDDQIAAQFGGNADAQRRIKDAAARRVGDFAGGGSYVQNKEGFAGVGTAR
jgi:hypothetical protein